MNDDADVLTWLYSTQKFGVKLGLDATRRLLDALDVDAGSATVFHVAGTNGKGSVCAFLESICRTGGLKTGLFTSPHLVSFRERIRLDFQPVDSVTLTRELRRIREIVADWEPHPTFFEIATTLAMRIFLDAGVEAIVLETGMGGRLDSTNAVDSDVVGIAAIALDHQKWLGQSLAEIAGEKAGIIKPGKPVVTLESQPPEALAVIQARARELDGPLHLVSRFFGEIGLAGEHQRENAAIAAKMAQISGLNLPETAITAGIGTASWPGRFHQLDHGGSIVIIDGAHNLAAAEALVKTWKSRFGQEKAAIVFGAVRDKEPEKLLHALGPITGAFFPTTVASQRGLSAQELAEMAETAGKSATPASDVAEALRLATKTRFPVLVTGSLFLAGKALEVLGWGEADFEPSEQ